MRWMGDDEGVRRFGRKGDWRVGHEGVSDGLKSTGCWRVEEEAVLCAGEERT